MSILSSRVSILGVNSESAAIKIPPRRTIKPVL